MASNRIDKQALKDYYDRLGMECNINPSEEEIARAVDREVSRQKRRPTKGSKEAKDHMAELREQRGKRDEP